MSSDDWPTIPLRSLIVDEFAGSWGDEPSQVERENAFILRSTNLDDDGSLNYSTAAPRVIERRDRVRKSLLAGDLIIEASGGSTEKPVGRVALFSQVDDRTYICSNFFRTIRPDHNVVDPRYLFHFLRRIYFLPAIWRFQQQTTALVNLKYRDYLSMAIRTPPLAAQRQIADELDAMDEEILRTEETREKSASLLNGLLDRLFQSHDAYTASGEMIELRDAAHWLSGGTPATNVADYWDGDIPWISAASLKSFRIDASLRYVTSRGAMAGSRVVPAGTTLCVVRGMSLKSEFRVGVTAREVAFGQDCKALIPIEGIDPWYLGYSIRSLEPKVLTLVDEAGHGTGRLETMLLERLAIHVPDRATQVKAVGIAQEAERLISSYDAEIGKLRALRQALTADLLTGRLRAPEEDDE